MACRTCANHIHGTAMFLAELTVTDPDLLSAEEARTLGDRLESIARSIITKIEQQALATAPPA